MATIKLPTESEIFLKRKAEFFNSTIHTTLPIDNETNALLQPTIEEYGPDSEGVSVVDFYLACCLKRYKGLYFLTRNHKDFPTRIFSRNFLFTIELEKDIRTYALYSYRAKIDVVSIPDVPF